MPYYTVPSAPLKQDFETLGSAMHQKGVSYFDMYALLEGEEALYHKLDSHWNNAGARLAYDGMLSALNQPHNSFDGRYKVAQNFEGDLERMFAPANPQLDEQIMYDKPPEAHFDFVGPSRTDIGSVKTISQNGEGSLLFFRDSFGNALIPFVATAYADATYLNVTPYTPDLLEPGQTLMVEIAQRNVRLLLTAAPRMPAPQRTLDESAAQPALDAALHTVTEEAGDYLHIYGSYSAKNVPGGSTALLGVQKNGETVYYEAFPVFEESLLKDREVSDRSARGYSLYIPISELPQGELNYTLALQSDDGTYMVIP